MNLDLINCWSELNLVSGYPSKIRVNLGKSNDDKAHAVNFLIPASFYSILYKLASMVRLP